jgi:hypothetical protein
MPATFDSRRLRIIAATDARFKTQMRAIANNIAALIQRAATGRTAGQEAIIPNTQAARVDLKAAIWEAVLKPYFIGPGSDALKGAEAQSPFAQLLMDGIKAVTRLAAQRQIAMIKAVVKDPVVIAYLTGPRPTAPITEIEAKYDPAHLFVDPNGYRLSDRVWQNSIFVRAQVDRLLDYEIGQGTSAVHIAGLLENFLTPDAAVSRTNKPYGKEGSFAARRLARTEITAAAGRATVVASQANPFVGGIRWALSGSHREADQCDENAHGGPNGDGVYAPASVPDYPNHPHCLCNLQPVAAQAMGDFVKDLRAQIDRQAAGVPTEIRVQVLKGMFGEDFMSRGLVNGDFQDALGKLTITRPGNLGRIGAERSPIVRPPAPPPPAKPYDLSAGAAVRVEIVETLTRLDAELEQIAIDRNELENKITARHQDYRARMAAPGVSLDEQERLLYELFALNNGDREASNALYDRTFKRRQTAALDILSLPNAERAQVRLRESSQFAGKAGVKDLRARAKTAEDFVNAVTANTAGGELGVRMELDTTGRASANRGVILIEMKEPIKTIVHEIGHTIEFQRGPAFRDKRIAWFDDRTKGDPVERLVDIYPGHGYRDNEVVKRDRFGHAYIGKLYPQDAGFNSCSEVVSMGIEELYKDPFSFAKRDANYFEFIVSYLRGTL